MPPFTRPFCSWMRTKLRTPRNTSLPRKSAQFSLRKKNCSTRRSRKPTQLRRVQRLLRRLSRARDFCSLHCFFDDCSGESLSRIIKYSVGGLQAFGVVRRQCFSQFCDGNENHFLFDRINGIAHSLKRGVNRAEHLLRLQFRFGPDALAHVVEGVVE